MLKTAAVVEISAAPCSYMVPISARSTKGAAVAISAVLFSTYKGGGGGNLSRPLVMHMYMEGGGGGYLSRPLVTHIYI